MMAGIKGKDTKPELALRRSLHAAGFRYRLHPRNIVGKPDLVLTKYQAAIFVHGCFWHRHATCRYATTPSTRTEFWEAKFRSNQTRDKVVRTALAQMGWRVAIVWECALRTDRDVTRSRDAVVDWLHHGGTWLEIGSADAA